MRASTTVQRTPAESAPPSDINKVGIDKIVVALNGVFADAAALYLKTKNFHWHISGPHFRDYHLMLDEQADQIFASIDPLAERVRKIGVMTLRSIGHISKMQSLKASDAERVAPIDMLRELLYDIKSVARAMRELHSLCNDYDDVATSSLLEIYIDETERRTWSAMGPNPGPSDEVIARVRSSAPPRLMTPT